MSENAKAIYCNLLSDEIVSIYGVSKEQAVVAVNHSAIQTLIRENPEYVDHVPLSCWAEEVHAEMFT